MTLPLGRHLCGDLATAETREWLVTNGIGGYACGTVAGLLTRHYHGLLVAALKPPLVRTLLLTKLDETARYAGKTYELGCDRWADGTITAHGYRHIERFSLEGTCPVWTFACGDALLEKRLWMANRANTTYVRYTLRRATESLALSLKALVNYRDHHSHTQADGWTWQLIDTVPLGLQITAFAGATPLWLLSDRAQVTPHHTWYRGYALAMEQYRGLYPYDDHYHVATFEVSLELGQSVTLIASTETAPELDGAVALQARRTYEQTLLRAWQQTQPPPPTWLAQWVLAADQFVVDRTVAGTPGKTVIAGYPWFGDWGRDTMIALPGLAIATGRPQIARPILRTFAHYIDQGMLPNLFPEAGETPEYNTVDATFWYFEAVRAYHAATGDDALLAELFPALHDIIDWHQRGTRYCIHRDEDGLIAAGEPGVQLTWMDAKVDDWVVTPRIGKPVEVNALWYNALVSMAQFAQHLGYAAAPYQRLAEQARQGFQRFWHGHLGYCYDVLDGPAGHDDSLRPNQIFAVALPATATIAPLLSTAQQKAVVAQVGKELLTSFGLRSLAPDHPDYRGRYGGDRRQRDGAYHQGTVWGWLIGPWVQAHLKVHKNPALARSFLVPLADHLYGGCLGTLSEIFDGDAPMAPRGAFAQAWSVAEVLRAWRLSQSPPA